MTIEEIAKILNDCASKKCDGCRFKRSYELIFCRDQLIKNMAEECRRIAEEVEDDKR